MRKARVKNLDADMFCVDKELYKQICYILGTAHQYTCKPAEIRRKKYRVTHITTRC